MSEIKEFLCVGCGELFDERYFIDYFYIEIQDKEYQYRIKFNREFFNNYDKQIIFPFPVKLDLNNYKILEQIPIHIANEQDLRNIAKAKELELKAKNFNKIRNNAIELTETLGELKSLNVNDFNFILVKDKLKKILSQLRDSDILDIFNYIKKLL